jgi:predicted component of type VI protein secretion system
LGKLWEHFSELYAEISHEAKDDFEAFWEEIVKANEEQIHQLGLKNRRNQS